MRRGCGAVFESENAIDGRGSEADAEPGEHVALYTVHLFKTGDDIMELVGIGHLHLLVEEVFGTDEPITGDVT